MVTRKEIWDTLDVIEGKEEGSSHTALEKEIKHQNRVSFVCTRASELRKGKTTNELTQKEAFKEANEEWRTQKCR